MNRYLIRRVLTTLPSVVILTIVLFALLRALPGDVALVILAGSGQAAVDPQEYSELRETLGLDNPFWVQYGHWVWGLVTLDGGDSLFTGRPVFTEIAEALPVTLELAILAAIIGLVIALPAGILSALFQDTWWDYIVRVFSIGGLAMPVFFTGALLILALVIFFGWLPPLQFSDFFDSPTENLKQMIFPAVVLGYTQAAVLSRMTRSSMLEVMGQDYVRTAMAKGLRYRVVVVRHALRNALIPVVTMSAVQFGQLLGGAVIIEGIFALPGLGFKLVEGVLNRDVILVQTIVTVVGISIIVLNLLVDILYSWLDPRIQYS